MHLLHQTDKLGLSYFFLAAQWLVQPAQEQAFLWPVVPWKDVVAESIEESPLAIFYCAGQMTRSNGTWNRTCRREWRRTQIPFFNSMKQSKIAWKARNTTIDAMSLKHLTTTIFSLIAILRIISAVILGLAIYFFVQIIIFFIVVISFILLLIIVYFNVVFLG